MLFLFKSIFKILNFCGTLIKWETSLIGLVSIWLPGKNAVTPISQERPPFILPVIIPSTNSPDSNDFSISPQISFDFAFDLERMHSPLWFSIFQCRPLTLPRAFGRRPSRIPPLVPLSADDCIDRLLEPDVFGE